MKKTFDGKHKNHTIVTVCIDGQICNHSRGDARSIVQFFTREDDLAMKPPQPQNVIKKIFNGVEGIEPPTSVTQTKAKQVSFSHNF